MRQGRHWTETALGLILRGMGIASEADVAGLSVEEFTNRMPERTEVVGWTMKTRKGKGCTLDFDVHQPHTR